MDTPEKAITQARQQLRQQAPFLDFILDQVALQPTTAIPGARVVCVPPRFTLEYNPTYLATLSPHQQAAVLEHELRHILHRHPERQGARDPERWNIACDMAINSHIVHLPEQALQPPAHLWGKSAEEIYDRLPADLECAAEHCCLTTGHDEAQEALDRAYRQLLSEAQRRFGPERIADELRRLAGDTPGTDAVLLRPQGELGVPWLDILARYSQSRAQRRSLARPDRRGLSPWGKVRERQPRVVVALDTSGSIAPALGAAFLAELQRLRPHCLALTIILADKAVHAVLPFEELAGTNFMGRGGTDFSATVAYVNLHLSDYDLCVYLTDGHGPLPTVQPAIPLVWVVTDNQQFLGHPAVFVRQGADTPAAPRSATRRGAVRTRGRLR